MTRKTLIFEILLIATALAATVIVWPHLLAQVPTHWNFRGQSDSQSPRWQLILIGPGFMSGLMLLTWLVPWLSPRHFQVDSFRSTYRQVMLMLFCLFAYVYAIILWIGLGHTVDGSRAIVGGVCLFSVLCGNLIGKVRRNFFIGVRTPWTLASDRIWNATHRFAAKTFVAGGLVGLLLSLIGLDGWPVFALLAGMLAPVVYSLVIYKHFERRGEL